MFYVFILYEILHSNNDIEHVRDVLKKTCLFYSYVRFFVFRKQWEIFQRNLFWYKSALEHRQKSAILPPQSRCRQSIFKKIIGFLVLLNMTQQKTNCLFQSGNMLFDNLFLWTGAVLYQVYDLFSKVHYVSVTDIFNFLRRCYILNAC